MAETPAVAEIRLALGRACLGTLKSSAYFRNNRGQAWVATRKNTLVERVAGFVRVVLTHARPINFGLVNGASDIIGWTSIIVTPDMVGQRVAVFTAIECKDPANPNAGTTEDQERFIGNVVAAGGYAGVARLPEDALRIVGILANDVALSPGGKTPSLEGNSVSTKSSS